MSIIAAGFGCKDSITDGLASDGQHCSLEVRGHGNLTRYAFLCSIRQSETYVTSRMRLLEQL